jgi:hypothetical protein
MTASKNDILHWIDEAKERGSAYLIIGLDPFDYDNFPIYCESGDECRYKIDDLLRTGNRYDEVYNMSMDIDDQINEYRAMNLPPEDWS